MWIVEGRRCFHFITLHFSAVSRMETLSKIQRLVCLKIQKIANWLPMRYSYIHGFGSRSKELTWQFFVCVCICICPFVSNFFTPIIHTLTHAAFYSVHLGARFPVPGLEDPSMGMNTEGSLPVWSLEILPLGWNSFASPPPPQSFPSPILCQAPSSDFYTCSSDFGH